MSIASIKKTEQEQIEQLVKPKAPRRKKATEPVPIEPTKQDLEDLATYLKQQLGIKAEVEPDIVVPKKRAVKKQVETIAQVEPKAPRKQSSWVVALKKWNEGKKYTIPKKGSLEYEEVRALMV
jgi:hypothetical protein